MVTRYTTKGDGAAVQIPGRANSERAIQGRNTKKWMDGIVDDSDGELDALISKLNKFLSLPIVLVPADLTN